jgi:hypothetical protein
MYQPTEDVGMSYQALSDGTWVARVFGNTEPHTIIQSPTGTLYALKLAKPDIWHIAGWIARQPGVYRLAEVDPKTDHKHTRRYDEFRFMAYPF